MSKIEELIQQYCPDGVEYKDLKNVTTAVNIGINPRKFFKLNPNDSIGFYVTVRELNGLLGVKQYEKTDLINQEAIDIIQSRANIEVGDILFSNTGTVGKLALVIDEPLNWGVNEGIYVIKPIKGKLESRFLYYYLDSNQANKEYSSKFTGSTLKHVTQQALLSLQVPVPPMEVQREIVHILDSFTFYTSELSAELSARREQYNYYRDKLLTFKTEVEWKKFGDIASIVRGASPRPISNYTTDDQNGIPWIKIGDTKPDSKYIDHTEERITSEGAKKSRMVHKGDFVLSNSMSFGRPYILKIDGCIHDGWLSISSFDNSFYPDFLYHLLNASYIQHEMAQRASSGTVKNLNADIVKALVLPVPSLKTQERIVRVLDNFDTICADLNIGLPAEIEARQKQYEYYRDLLLTFDNKAITMPTDRQTDRQNIIRLFQYVFGYAEITLSEVGKVSMCKRIMKSETTPEGDVPFYKIGTFGGKANAYISNNLYQNYKEIYSYPNKGDILISAAGTIGRTVRYDGEPAYYQDSNIVWLSNDEHLVLNDYLYYVYQLQPWYVSSGGTIARIYNENIEKARIKIPPLSRQRQIVEQLDAFTQIKESITEGLPAEIESRQKQYEYYRDKLLDFKRL